MNETLKIGVCSRSFSKNETLRKELLSKFSKVVFNDSGASLNGDDLVEFLQDCDGAVVALEFIDESILSRLPKLSFIGKYGVGLDKVDFESMDRNGVMMGWTPGVNSVAVSELTLNLALTIVRNTMESSQLAEQLNWKQVIGKQLSSLTFGVLGYGHVGTKVAKLAKAFNCNVVVYDKVDKSQACTKEGIQFVSKDELFAQADIVSVHVPGNKETHHLIGENEISKMKDGSYLVNTARGGIVDENAVLQALESGKLTSVAFDVLEVEPPINDLFIGHPKTLVTTHIGGSSEEAILAMGRAAIIGLQDYRPATDFSVFK